MKVICSVNFQPHAKVIAAWQVYNLVGHSVLPEANCSTNIWDDFDNMKWTLKDLLRVELSQVRGKIITILR